MSEGYQITPKKVDGGGLSRPSKKVVFIAAGNNHSACITEDGSTYTWGYGGDGRRGHGDESNWCSSPKLVDGLVGKKAKEVACGGRHTLVCTDDGRVYSFGYGSNGQLGHGNNETRLTPTFIEAAPLGGEFVVQVACGHEHSMALTSKGCVYTWGNGHRFLGHGSKVDNHTTPSMVKGLFGKNKVVQISSYYEHSVALVDSKQQSYAKKMKAMVNNESCSDVVFVLENDDRVYAIKALLIDRSEYFRAMFRSNMRESRENEVVVRGCSKGVFLLLLQYLYIGVVDVGMDHAFDLYVLADRYLVNGLSRQCVGVFKRGLTNENAIHILVEVDGLGLDDLKDVCMAYVVSNYNYGKQMMTEEDVESFSDALKGELLMRFFERDQSK
jgi:RCC1 and BTB domain-containing protein